MTVKKSTDMVFIPQEKIEEFKELYRKHFALDLTDQQALEKGSKLLNFMRILAEPNSEKKLEK